jgi:hypothetical protein
MAKLVVAVTFVTLSWALYASILIQMWQRSVSLKISWDYSVLGTVRISLWRRYMGRWQSAWCWLCRS